MNKSEQEKKMRLLQQEEYIVHLLHEKEGKQTPRWVMIATRSTPEQCCGHATRIGSFGDQALYRLKVRYGPEKQAVLTLSDLFVLSECAFLPVSDI